MVEYLINIWSTSDVQRGRLIVWKYIIRVTMTRTCFASENVNTKVICRSIVNHVLLYHFPKITCWKKFFHFKFGLLLFDICVCCDKMAPRRWSANSSIKTKQIFQSCIRFYSKFFLGKYYYKKWSVQTHEHIKAQFESSKNFESYPSS